MASSVPLDFAQLKKRKTPNDYLACPLSCCERSEPDRALPVLEISAADLKKLVDGLVSDLPRASILYSDDRHVTAEQRSAVFGFADYVDIEVTGIGESSSTLSIYSRSKYGFYDFGVNKRRVETLLKEILANKY